MTRLGCVLVIGCMAGGCHHREPPGPEQSSLPVAVDRRVELMSIVFRLAGRPRYTEASTPYARDVDREFARMRDHRAVVFTRQLGERYGFGYEMAPTLAVYLDDDLQPRTPLDPLPAPLARWRGANLATYLEAVRDFAKVGDLDGFLASHRAYAVQVEARDRARFGSLPVVTWYERVFGTRPQTHHHLVPGLLTGPMDYAARVELPDGSEDQYVIAHLDRPDAEGIPAPGEAAVPYVVHEVGHSYANPIVDAALDQLVPVAHPAIARVADQMNRQAYRTDAIVLEESVVRALVVLWLRDQQGSAAGDAEITSQERLGFTWTRALADALSAARRDGRLSAAAIVTATRDVFARLP